MSEQATDPKKKLICDALNEHGFLLQQVIRKKIEGPLEGAADPEEKWQDKWRFVAAEYPVRAADGSQTRIDLLLRHKHATGMHVCMECKRPNPKFKKWVFFDRESSVAGMRDWEMRLETLYVAKRPAEPQDIRRNVGDIPNTQRLPLFSYYVEAGLKRDGSASSTETIEKAFQQLMKAHSGLMAKLELISDPGFLRSIPVLVTTAELLEAQFDPKRVSVETGMVAESDLQLAPLEYCAVNYRGDDSLALGLPTPSAHSASLKHFINAQMRTVFIVRSTALHRFLNWAAVHLTSHS